jgi:formyltetrahydrofolate-dependent phosphoribosylglycinamide formyltransferase
MNQLVVLVSGHGSNLQAILDACAQRELPARVIAVFSDRSQAPALERARRVGIPAVAFPWQPYKEAGCSRGIYDSDLAAGVAGYNPDLVVLAGWMRLLTGAFLNRFPGRVINLHPAVPGAFPGTHAILRAWEAFQAGEIHETGVMVHYVPDEGVDSGPLIAVERVPILSTDSLESLEERIHQVEHRLLVAAIRNVLETRDEH